MAKTSKTKDAKRRVKVASLSTKEANLSKSKMKRVKGGLLPYIEQDNVRGSSNITDGTSNTIIKK